MREIDARLAPQPRELRFLVRCERIEVRDAVQVDVDGLERERAASGIRTVLPWRHFVERQELPERAGGGEQPVRDASGVRVAPEIAGATAHRGERQEESGPPPEIEPVSHGALLPVVNSMASGDCAQVAAAIQRAHAEEGHH